MKPRRSQIRKAKQIAAALNAVAVYGEEMTS